MNKMNRTVSLKMGLELLKKYTYGELDRKIFEEILNSTEYEEYDENSNAYITLQIIYYLFEHQRYYKVLDFLFEFYKYLLNLSSPNDIYFNKLNLIIASLKDSESDIEKRVEIETLAHIVSYIEEQEIKTEDARIESFSNNIVDLRAIANIEELENREVEQQTLSDYIKLLLEQDSKRELLSKVNYNFKIRYKKIIANYIVVNYTNTNFFNFVFKLITSLNSLNLEPQDKEKIIELCFFAIQDIDKYIEKIYEKEKKKINKHQLTLFNCYRGKI